MSCPVTVYGMLNQIAVETITELLATLMIKKTFDLN